MSLLKRIIVNLNDATYVNILTKNNLVIIRTHTSFNKERNKPKEEDEFRVLNILPKPKENLQARTMFKPKVAPQRASRMPVDQDWTNVWPGPRTFHPASVPLPVRQGFSAKGAPPSKYGNAELMKIPNFLHLTPPAITKHCSALKKWCTPWPEELKTEEDMDEHFPINVIATDYCHSSPTIRDPESRVICLKFKLSSLQFDDHSRDKFLRLVGERYDPKSDVVTITTDSCPLKKQNYNYAQYLLAALYHESWNVEDWESEKTEADQEKYVWSDRPAKKAVLEAFAYNGRSPPDLKSLGNAVENLFNEGEDLQSIEEYKKCVLNVLDSKQ